MLVFIGKQALDEYYRVPTCQGLSHLSAFLHHLVLTNLATSSQRVNGVNIVHVHNGFHVEILIKITVIQEIPLRLIDCSNCQFS